MCAMHHARGLAVQEPKEPICRLWASQVDICTDYLLHKPISERSWLMSFHEVSYHVLCLQVAPGDPAGDWVLPGDPWDFEGAQLAAGLFVNIPRKFATVTPHRRVGGP